MATDYEITNQRYTTMTNKAGRLVPVVEVSFETKPEGIAGKVDVPQAGYGAATAIPMVEAAVKALKEVHGT
jgi:hypothetical protein